MTDKSAPPLNNLRLFLQTYRQETGQSLIVWFLIALLSLLTQVVLHGELLPGEFGTFNTTLGVIGLMCVPFIALVQAFAWHLDRKPNQDRSVTVAALRAAAPLVIETFAWVWAAITYFLLIFTLPLLGLPRFAVNMWIILNVFIVLGTLLSAVKYRDAGRMRFWIGLLLTAAFARLALSLYLGSYAPYAEAGLAAFLFAGLITFAPVLKLIEAKWDQRLAALKTALDRVFLIDLGAIFSVFLGIYLFSSADRIVAQSWFGSASDNNFGYIDWGAFDAYQTAGLLARAILWGTQPLLLMFYARRSKVDRTTAASLDWFWIYLGALITGVTLLEVFKSPVTTFFCGRLDPEVIRLVPTLAMAMVPLGLLQGVGIYGLASRRYPECFVFGCCSIAYLLLLYLVGRHPAIMPAYMFGGALVALMIVLFVGVVRWGRKQP